MYSVDTIVLSFFIYSVLGWICEVVYCSVPKKKFINRGFLYGPYLPVYGFGATFVVVLLQNFTSHWYLVFIFGVLITSVLEYFTSFALEKLFKVKLWDYSTYPLNINGRVCALNSTLFGILSLILVYGINRPVYSFLSSMNTTLVNILSLVVVALMSADTAFSVAKMAQFRKVVEEIAATRNEIERRLKVVLENLSGEALAENRARLAAEREAKKQEYYQKVRRFFFTNPGLVPDESMKAQFELARSLVNEQYRKRIEEKKAARLAKKQQKKGRKNG